MGNARYKVAIIGTGRMGGLIEDELKPNAFSMPYGHFSAYRAIEETEVVAVANRSSLPHGRSSTDKSCHSESPVYH